MNTQKKDTVHPQKVRNGIGPNKINGVILKAEEKLQHPQHPNWIEMFEANSEGLAHVAAVASSFECMSVSNQ